MEIPLDRDEPQILRDTERKEFRDLLSGRKAVLEKVIDALGSATTD